MFEVGKKAICVDECDWEWILHHKDHPCPGPKRNEIVTVSDIKVFPIAGEKILALALQEYPTDPEGYKAWFMAKHFRPLDDLADKDLAQAIEAAKTETIREGAL